MYSPRPLSGIPYKRLALHVPMQKSLFTKPNSITKSAHDWLISAIDPFHDFEHPIEGAPDESVSRSYTRVFRQTETVGCTADDDRISILFTGSHGSVPARFYPWGVDYEPDPLVTVGGGVFSIAPITVARCAAAIDAPDYGRISAGTATVIGSFYTRQVSDIPSRLVSLGIEVVDTTQALYKRGTLVVAHSNGEVERGSYAVADAAGFLTNVNYYRKPCCPMTATQCITLPGSYQGPVAKGCYTQARLNKIQPPQSGTLKHPNLSTYGSAVEHPLLAMTDTGGSGALTQYAPTVISGMAATVSAFHARHCWSDSGFCPFSIVMTGLSSFTTLQITVKSTVEYFPQTTHPFECGLATYSPSYEPEAFRIYHEIMRQLPGAVPVGMNPGGEFWKMVLNAARNVVGGMAKYGPTAGRVLQLAGASMGIPEMVAVGKGVSLVTGRLPKPKPKPKGGKQQK